MPTVRHSGDANRSWDLDLHEGCLIGGSPIHMLSVPVATAQQLLTAVAERHGRTSTVIADRGHGTTGTPLAALCRDRAVDVSYEALDAPRRGTFEAVPSLRDFLAHRSLAIMDEAGVAPARQRPQPDACPHAVAADAPSAPIRAVKRYAALLLAFLAAYRPALAQAPAPYDPNLTPAYGTDPAHGHKAYARTTYGIGCPGDRVVWVNTRTGVYHLEGERWFGRTSQGRYLCEKAARAEGDRETRNGQ